MSQLDQFQPHSPFDPRKVQGAPKLCHPPAVRPSRGAVGSSQPVSQPGFEGEALKRWLGDRDSNPDSTVQSRMSYRWTISQCARVNG